MRTCKIKGQKINSSEQYTNINQYYVKKFINHKSISSVEEETDRFLMSNFIKTLYHVRRLFLYRKKMTQSLKLI